MANARGKEIDNTHLSIDQAEARGFIHRDYIAHCLRWTKIAKDLNLGGKYKEADIIDVGCGKDMPLARMLMTNRMAPRSYVGVEYNRMEIPEMFDNTTFQPHLIQNVDFTQTDIMEDSFNVSVCLEVLEHVEPLKATAILDKLADVVVQGGTCYFSTPCYDEKVGAAKNHVNEMTYEAFGAVLEAKGFQIVDHYGTFASQKDYKHQLDDNTKQLYSKLSEYYDTNYLATIFAPLYPSMSRNVLWKCINTQSKDFTKRFPPIREMHGLVLGSSDRAHELRYA